MLTLDEVARLWAGEVVDGTNCDDVSELLNNGGAFNLVAEYFASGEPITRGIGHELEASLRAGAGNPTQAMTSFTEPWHAVPTSCDMNRIR